MVDWILMVSQKPRGHKHHVFFFPTFLKEKKFELEPIKMENLSKLIELYSNIGQQFYKSKFHKCLGT